MADIYSLAERVRGKLTQEASRKDPHLRRVLGHAKLLDDLLIELSATESTWNNESDAQDEAVVGSEEDKCDPEDSDDSDSDSDSDSDLDWGSDSDSDSETDPDSDSDSSSEWRSYAYYSADVESAARDWAQIECWKAAKPIADGRPIEVSVQEVRDESET